MDTSDNISASEMAAFMSEINSILVNQNPKREEAARIIEMNGQAAEANK